MIEIKAKKHDKFSVEFKVGYVADDKQPKSEFAVNTWFFVPNSFDVNPQTYGKKQFWRDMKSNIRLITPSYPLDELDTPLAQLRKALATNDQAEYEYHIKMFVAIAKSSLRDASQAVRRGELSVDKYIEAAEGMLVGYRNLGSELYGEVCTFYEFGDEFLSHLVEYYTILILRRLPNALLAELCHKEEAYKRAHGYLVVEQDDPNGNRDLVFRYGLLKKYVESDMFIHLDKKQDGFAVEQIYYSIAAGLAMVFATVVAFSVQRIYGAVSVPLFAALVVSYMLKDRIKELTRYYFAHKLLSKYFDNKADIRIKNAIVGTVKEAVDFIPEKQVPEQVLALRNRSSILQAENRIFDEKILLYRKLVTLDNEILAKNSDYPTAGINDIMRLHVTRFTQKMDDAIVPLRKIDGEGNIAVIPTEKIYYLNALMQLKSASQTEYRRFRIVMSHDGIVEIQEFN